MPADCSAWYFSAGLLCYMTALAWPISGVHIIHFMHASCPLSAPQTRTPASLRDYPDFTLEAAISHCALRLRAYASVYKNAPQAFARDAAAHVALQMTTLIIIATMLDKRQLLKAIISLITAYNVSIAFHFSYYPQACLRLIYSFIVLLPQHYSPRFRQPLAFSPRRILARFRRDAGFQRTPMLRRHLLRWLFRYIRRAAESFAHYISRFRHATFRYLRAGDRRANMIS